MFIIKKIKSYLLTGLSVLLPIILTIYAIKFFVSFISSFTSDIVKYVPFLQIKSIPHSEIVTLIFLIIALGYITKLLFLERFISTLEEKIVKKIPLISNLYLGIKKITSLIKKNSDERKQTVVWVKINENETYIIGFLVNTIHTKHTPNNQIFYSIFIPTTPNPVTGYNIITKKENIMYTDINREDALSMIISGGIIQPK